jgi:hypothetical protein
MNMSVIARTSVLVGAAAVSMTLLPPPANAESAGNCGRSWDDWYPDYGYVGSVAPVSAVDDNRREATFTILPSDYVNWSIAGFGSAKGTDRVAIHPNDFKVEFNTDFGRGLGRMYTIALTALACSTRGVAEARVTVRDFNDKTLVFKGSVNAY